MTRLEREQARIADEIDGVPVRHRGVEGAAVRQVHPAAGAGPHGGGGLGERGVPHEPADDDRAAGDPALGAPAPADAPGARVQGVEPAVVGPDVDSRSPARHVRDRGRGIHVVAGALAPGETARVLVVRVDVAVGVADVDPPVGDSRRRVERAAPEPEWPRPRLGSPDTLPVAGPDRVDAAAVVAEVEPAAALVEGQAALHGAAGPVPPEDRAVVSVQGIDGAVLRPEVQLAAVHERRRLGATAQAPRPPGVAVVGRDRHHAASLRALEALEDGDEHGVVRVRRGRGRQEADLAPPVQPPRLATECVQAAVVAQEVDRVASEDRRELEEHRPAKRPALVIRRTEVLVRRQVARARLPEAEDGPGEASLAAGGGRRARDDRR